MYVARIAVTAVALLAASLLVPGMRIRWGAHSETALATLLVLAVVLGIIDAFVRPALRLFSLPLNLLTLGTFTFALNAGLLLLLAGVVDALWRPVLVVGGFPPELTGDAFVTAIAASLVVSVASTALAALIPGV